MSSDYQPEAFKRIQGTRNKALSFGMACFVIGMHTSKFFELTETQEVASRTVALCGILCVAGTLMKSIQDYRINDDGDGEEGDGGGDDEWPDDDDPPPIVPNDPSGIKFDWTEDIEAYLKEHDLTSV